MLTTDHTPRRLTRAVCAALGDGHRCLLNHSSPDLYPVFTHPQSPVARLSNEELLLIFEEALYSVFSDPITFVQPRKPAILVTISHVCRRWRGIALSNSCLWTNVFSCSLSEVQQHLSRSGTRPLTIYGLFSTQQANAGSSSKEADSAAIAAALVEKAYRWKALLWTDSSANNTANVLRLMKTPNAYPILERLEITIPECVHLEIRAATGNARDGILFPALRSLALTRVHLMVLPHSAMPSLQNLKLEGLMRRLLFSQLFSLLSGSPALRVLILHHTLPTLDPHLLVNTGPSSRRWFPTGPLRSPLKLPELVYLSLSPAPASGLWFLFVLLDLPALECLDLQVYTDPHTADWLYLNNAGRLITLPFRTGPGARVVRLPALRTLRVTYCITSAPTARAAPAADAPPTLPQLQRLAFPALADLQITHAFVRTPAVQGTQDPPSLPLRPFDALFHAPAFTRLTRLTLAGCALPFRALCGVLQTRFPALEVLVLSACSGAGALVCALAPGECGGGCEGWGAWIGRKVRVVVVSRCEDVRAGCLRKVIQARLRANDRGVADPSPSRGTVANANATDAASASKPERTRASTPPAPSSEPAVGSDLATRGDRPQRIAVVQVLECARVTEDDVRALATTPGAPTLVWASKRSKHGICIPAAAVPQDVI